MTINFLISLSIITLIVINLFISKEILSWVKSRSRILSLLALLWFVPVVGAYQIYQKEDVSPTWKYRPYCDSGNHSKMGSFLMEVDAIFNPSSRAMIEIIEKQVLTIKEDQKQKFDPNTMTMKSFSQFIKNR